jgi:hypothetical protein
MSSIEEQRDPRLVGDRLKRVDIADPAPEMHAHNRSGLRGNGSANSSGIDRMRFRIDVNEYRRQSLPSRCVSCCDERERRHDHFAAQLKGAEQHLHSHRGVRHSDYMLRTRARGQFSLESPHERSIVGKPFGVEDFV